MAKLSSTARLPSRSRQQDADQAPPHATAPVARYTRSHTIADSDDEQPSRRTTRASARAASVESDASIVTPKRGRPRKKAKAAVTAPLTPVDELLSDDDDGGKHQQAAVAVEIRQEPENTSVPDHNISRQSIGAASAISGTTAKTSWSDEEAALLDSVLIIDSLVDLNTETDNLLSICMPSDPSARTQVWKDILLNNTREQKVFRRRFERFQDLKACYAQGQGYIQPSTVLKAALKLPSTSDLSSGNWRPDPVLMKANLFQMLNDLVLQGASHQSPTPEFNAALETIEHLFPTVVAGSQYSDNAFDVSLKLTTQVAIMRMESFMLHPAHDLPGTATDSFIVEGQDGEQVYRHWQALQMHTLNEQRQTALKGIITGEILALRQPFDSQEANSPVDAVTTLRNSHPWSDLVSSLVQFYEERKAELDEQIEHAGGIDAISKALGARVDERAELLRAEELLESLTNRPAASVIVPPPKQSIKAYKDLRKKKVQQPPAPTASMAGPAIHENVIDPNLTASVTQGNNATLGDRLANKQGERIMAAPDLDEDTYEFVEVDPEHEVQRSSGKRRLEDEDEEYEEIDPTQDEGFQSDDRGISAANERRRQGRLNRPAPRPRDALQLASSSATNLEEVDTAQRAQTVLNQNREDNGQTTSLLVPGDTQQVIRPESTLDLITAATAATRRTQPRVNEQRPRKAWTNAETVALVDLIQSCAGEPRIPYRNLKTRDEEDRNILRDRDNEDIRFKARELKVTFLIAETPDRPLPPGFDLVNLGHKEVQKLHRRGIPYVQERIRARRTEGTEDE